jgi:hypothetical protein
MLRTRNNIGIQKVYGPSDAAETRHGVERTTLNVTLSIMILVQEVNLRMKAMPCEKP